MKKDQTIKVYKCGSEQPSLIIKTSSCGNTVTFDIKDKEQNVTIEHWEDDLMVIVEGMINQFDISIWRLFFAKLKWWIKIIRS